MPIITAGAIIINDEKKILLVKRASDKKLFPNAWSFPGGKLEEGESLDEAVVREVKEETGLDLVSFEKYSFTGHTPQNARSINHLYIGKAKGVPNPRDGSQAIFIGGNKVIRNSISSNGNYRKIT